MRLDPQVPCRYISEAVSTSPVPDLVSKGPEKLSDLPGVTQVLSARPVCSLLVGRTRGVAFYTSALGDVSANLNGRGRAQLEGRAGQSGG